MSFRNLFAQSSSSERLNIQTPRELPTAWIHLLLSLIFTTEDMQLFDEQMMICNELLEQGMKKVVGELSAKPLSEYIVFAPFDLALLMSFQLSQGPNGSSLDISESYLEYLKSLVS